MDASVIIPAYNEEDSISLTLDSLKGQDAEVIVVVDGDDSTEDIAESHEAVDKVVSGEGTGAGAARNRGLEASNGEVVLFTDADTIVPSDWVKKHVRHYKDESVVGVGGPARPIEDSLKNRVMFRINVDYWYRISWKFGFIQQPGFNASFRKKDFTEEGGFNETISFLEDTELSLRMKKHGKIPYDKHTKVETSARRENELGYIKLFVKFAKAYTNHYILNRGIEQNYFDSEDEEKN